MTQPATQTVTLRVRVYGLVFIQIIAHAVRALRRDGLGWLALGLISEGAREIYQPAGMIVAGVLILAGVFLHARGQTLEIAAPELHEA